MTTRELHPSRRGYVDSVKLETLRAAHRPVLIVGKTVQGERCLGAGTGECVAFGTVRPVAVTGWASEHNRVVGTAPFPTTRIVVKRADGTKVTVAPARSGPGATRRYFAPRIPGWSPARTATVYDRNGQVLASLTVRSV